MLFIISFLNVLLPILYGLLLTVYVIEFYSNDSKYINFKKILLLTTIAVHFLYFIFRTVEFNHFLITTKFELFTSIAFTITLSYIIIEMKTKVRITGFLILVFPFIFQLVSSLFIENIYDVKEVLRNPLLGLHVISALLGDSSLIISAVYGILFIILYNRIRKHNYGTYFTKLPSLEILEKMSFQSLFLGFIILSISILIGAIWLPYAFPEFSHFDPKLVSTIFIWLIYALGISAKIIFKWYGKKVIFLSIFGCIMLIISMLLPFIIKTSFHKFL